jgi:hypothetical protein
MKVASLTQGDRAAPIAPARQSSPWFWWLRQTVLFFWFVA